MMFPSFNIFDTLNLETNSKIIPNGKKGAKTTETSSWLHSTHKKGNGIKYF